MATTAKTFPVGRTSLVAYTGAANTVSSRVSPGAVITVSHGTATTLTLPESTVVDFPLGTVFFVIQLGAGAVTVAKTGSDTIVGSTATVAAGDMIIVAKTSATGWHVGDGNAT